MGELIWYPSKTVLNRAARKQVLEIKTKFHFCIDLTLKENYYYYYYPDIVGWRNAFKNCC